MENKVLVLNTNKQPLDPIRPAAARILLDKQAAAVYRRYPFTIILKAARPAANPTPIQLNCTRQQNDRHRPGTSQYSYLCGRTNSPGQAFRLALAKRRALRRNRRSRKTRYRQSRFNNRTRSQGWLAPSL